MALVEPEIGPVEARSLSSIINLAANPPAYPRNPTQQPLDPLVLYIIRVPGSRDVVLTPLKPPTKSSISAESIQASLYYLHVATPEDDAVLRTVTSDHISHPKATHYIGDQATVGSIRRKPIADQPVEGRPPTPPPHRRPVNQHSHLTDASIHRQPGSDDPKIWETSHDNDGKENLRREVAAHLPDFRTSQVDPHSTNEPSDRTNLFHIPRRPIDNGTISNTNQTGLAYAAQDTHTVVPPRLSFENTTYTGINTENIATQSQVLPGADRPPFSEHYDNDNNQKDAFDPNTNGLASGGFVKPQIYITLIRRDPTHGLQWNVGALHRSDADREIINIDISTPGYGKFIGRDEPLSMTQLASILPPTVHIGTSEPAVRGLKSQHPSTGPPSSLDTGSRTFNRRLMTVSRATSRRDRALEAVKTNLLNTESQHSRELKAGYFTFTSPWNGTCTFVASADGHSLKCKHLIPSPPNTITVDPDRSSRSVVTVAEVRSNIQFPLGHGNHAPSHSTLSSSSSRGPLPPPPTLKERAKNSPLASVLNSVHQKASRARAGSGSRTGPEVSSLFSNLHRHQPHHGRSYSDSHSNSNSDNETPPVPPPHGITQTNHPRTGEQSFDEDRLDFSLAREHAGGGVSGKEAKLGKLIIFDEGLKMLDLVVAACMGVWWQSYG